MENELWTIKPAPPGLVLMACIGVPFILFAVGTGGFLALSGDAGSAVYAVVPFVLGCWCLLEISTVRLHLSTDRLWLSRWWHTRWSVPRDKVELRAGRVGDVPFLPGLHVIELGSGKKIGEIISGQFHADDLQRLVALISRGTA